MRLLVGWEEGRVYSRNFGKLPLPSIFEKLGNWETSIVPIVRVRVTVGLGLGFRQNGVHSNAHHHWKIS